MEKTNYAPFTPTWDSIKKIDREEKKAERWAKAVMETCSNEVSVENIRNAEVICGYKITDIIWKIRALFPFWNYKHKGKVQRITEKMYLKEVCKNF